MVKSSSGLGGDFLARKSEISKVRQTLTDLKDILVVDDETFDAGRLSVTLHVIFGYDVKVRLAKTLATALDEVIKSRLQLVFLDDISKPSDTATE